MVWCGAAKGKVLRHDDGSDGPRLVLVPIKDPISREFELLEFPLYPTLVVHCLRNNIGTAAWHATLDVIAHIWLLRAGRGRRPPPPVSRTALACA